MSSDDTPRDDRNGSDSRQPLTDEEWAAFDAEEEAEAEARESEEQEKLGQEHETCPPREMTAADWASFNQEEEEEATARQHVTAMAAERTMTEDEWRAFEQEEEEEEKVKRELALEWDRERTGVPEEMGEVSTSKTLNDATAPATNPHQRSQDGLVHGMSRLTLPETTTTPIRRRGGPENASEINNNVNSSSPGLGQSDCDSPLPILQLHSRTLSLLNPDALTVHSISERLRRSNRPPRD
ncbi:hypothetical protein DFH27DRAFT_529338 [Peziza echinospora]|nr:hypothetical protein DFH27DRAFT_529338 [Peziza echinospora]